MSYPGNPPGGQNEGYGYTDPNAGSPYQPPQAPPQYNTQPVSPAYGPPPDQQYGAQPVSPAYGPPPDQQQYNTQPVSPAYGPPPVPQQPTPTHDGGTSQLPQTYNLDSSVSAPPTTNYAAQPTNYAGQPMSGPPMSGPPNMYGPVSAPPGYPGQPYADPNLGGPPPKKRGVAVPILASLLALAVIAAAVFVGLYVDKSGKLDKSQKLAAQRQTTLTATEADLTKTRDDLKAKADELTKAQQDLRGTQADSTEAKRQRDVIGNCLTLLFAALDASAAGDKATLQTKLNDMKKPCDEAQVLLGS